MKIKLKDAAKTIVAEMIQGGFGEMPEHLTAYSWVDKSQTGYDISYRDEFTAVEEKKLNRHVMRLWAKAHDLDDDWRKEWRV